MTFTYLNRALRNSPPPAHVMCRTPDYRFQWLRLRDAIQPGLTLGGLTVLAIVGEHVYLRQAFRTNTTRRWKLHKLSAFRHNRPRRWPYHETPVRMPIESVIRIMRDEKGRWGSAICAPLTAIEARFIEQRGEWDWSGEGKIVCRWRESSRRGREIMREPSTEYDNLTADELLDVVRKTWIDYDLKSAIETAPPDDDYIAAHIIDVAVYATPAIPRPLAELAEARERIRELEAENRHMEMTLIWIWVTTRDPIIEARLINEYPSIAEKGTADSPQP